MKEFFNTSWFQFEYFVTLELSSSDTRFSSSLWLRMQYIASPDLQFSPNVSRSRAIKFWSLLFKSSTTENCHQKMLDLLQVLWFGCENLITRDNCNFSVGRKICVFKASYILFGFLSQQLNTCLSELKNVL